MPDTNKYSLAGKKAAHKLWENGSEGFATKDPRKMEFSEAAINCFADILFNGSKTLRDMLQGAIGGATELNVGEYHGINELIQNADDTGARSTRLKIISRNNGNFLLFCHDGSPVEIQHVLPLVVTFLSTKKDDENTFGKFGIGLKTCNRFSDLMEVHCSPYHFCLKGQTLNNISPYSKIKNFYNANSSNTLFVFRLRKSFDEEKFQVWVKSWGDSSLLFLKSVKKFIVSIGATQQSKFNFELKTTEEESGKIKIRGIESEIIYQKVQAKEKKWHKISIAFDVPIKLKRALKKTSKKTWVSVAVPDHGEVGRVFVGLPTELKLGYPVSLNAQFDADSSRERITQSNWNIWLLSKFPYVISEAMNLLFRDNCKDVWRLVPLQDKQAESDGWFESELIGVLDKSLKLMQSIGKMLVKQIEVPLGDISYTSPELNEIVNDEDLLNLFPENHPIPKVYLTKDESWYLALNKLSCSREAMLVDAMALCSNEEHLSDKAKEWFLKLSDKVAEECKNLLNFECRKKSLNTNFLLLADGSRCCKNDGPFLQNAKTDNLSARHQLLKELNASYFFGATFGATTISWLENDNLLFKEKDALYVLEAFVEKFRNEIVEASNDDLKDLAHLIAELDRMQRKEIGEKLGAVLKVRSFEWVKKKKKFDWELASNCYMPNRIYRDTTHFIQAAGKTRGLIWVDPSYEKVLKAPDGTKRSSDHVGASAFFSSLGSLRAPKIIETDPKEILRGWGNFPSHQEQAFPAHNYTRKKIFNDSISPDLDLILADILKSNKREFVDRGCALFETLAKNWDHQYEPFLSAQSQFYYYSWQNGSDVSSTWLHKLKSCSWVIDKKGKKRAPQELFVETPYTKALYGDHPSNFIGKVEYEDGYNSFVTVLGLTVNPKVSELLDLLKQIRSEWRRNSSQDAKKVSFIYFALAELCWNPSISGKVGDISVYEFRRVFDEKVEGKNGLILVDKDWYSRSQVRMGRKIFGSKGIFVNSTEKLIPLWKVLGVYVPQPSECIDVLVKITNFSLSENERPVLIDTLRYLNTLSDKLTNKDKRRLKSLPLWCGSSWESKRPIFLFDQPKIVKALNGNQLVCWDMPIDLQDIKELLPFLGVEHIYLSDLKVKFNSEVIPALEDDQNQFEKSLSIFQTSLATGAINIYESNEITWQKFGKSKLSICQNIMGSFYLVQGGTEVKIRLLSFYDLDEKELIVSSEVYAFERDIGGGALSVCFSNPSFFDTIKDKWYYAVNEAEKGDEIGSLQLSDVSGAGDGNFESLLVDLNKGKGVKTYSKKSKEGGKKSPNRKKVKHRELKPIAALETVEISVTAPNAKIISKAKKKGLKSRSQIKRGNTLGSLEAYKAGNQRSFSNLELEDRAKLCLQHVLETAKRGDIRDLSQFRGVGADVMSDGAYFWEIKSTAREQQTSIDMSANEFARAREISDKFWLVLVSGLEVGYDTKVTLINDPCANLSWATKGIVTMSGIKDARSITVDVKELISPDD